MRTHTITQDEYNAVLDDIIDTFHDSLLEVLQDGYHEFDMYEEQYLLFDFFADEWFESPLQDSTYESIAHASAVQNQHKIAESASHDINYQDGAQSALDDLTYQYVKQELYERVEPFADAYAVAMKLHYTLNTLTTHTDADTLHNEFAMWFFHERNANGNTAAAILDTIEETEFTPEHIELRAFIDPTNTKLLIALHHWLLDAYADTYSTEMYEPDFLNPELADESPSP